MLQQDTARGDTERMQHDIEQIHTAADKMKHLLDDLLELSRLGRLMNPPEAVNLTSLAHKAAALVTGRIAERGVEVDIAPEMPVVHVDRGRLLEVLLNLVDNAVKYMGEQPVPRVEIGAEVNDEAVVCSVRDNGIGIEPRYHEKIFGLFEQLDQKVEGTGIGLALVRRIVEVHGGRIWVESEGQGRGSTFRFTLPRYQAQVDLLGGWKKDEASFQDSIERRVRSARQSRTSPARIIGMLKSCPILRGSASPKAACGAFTNSIKKRAPKTSTRNSPVSKPRGVRSLHFR